VNEQRNALSKRTAFGAIICTSLQGRNARLEHEPAQIDLPPVLTIELLSLAMHSVTGVRDSFGFTAGFGIFAGLACVRPLS
jgi:hypothetical protein